MDNGYIIQLSGWEAFFQAIENHWLTALFVFIALCVIASALSPQINITSNKEK